MGVRGFLGVVCSTYHRVKTLPTHPSLVKPTRPPSISPSSSTRQASAAVGALCAMAMAPHFFPCHCALFASCLLASVRFDEAALPTHGKKPTLTEGT